VFLARSHLGMQEDSEAGFCAVSSQTELKLLAGQGNLVVL
jgi:hypothetical protein